MNGAETTPALTDKDGRAIHGTLDSIVGRILDRIEEEAAAADRQAEQACARSKYTVQDYWMCVEFKFQRLHDELARELGLTRRCRTFAFRKRLTEFKRQVAADAANAS